MRNRGELVRPYLAFMYLRNCTTGDGGCQDVRVLTDCYMEFILLLTCGAATRPKEGVNLAIDARGLRFLQFHWSPLVTSRIGL